MNLSEGMKERFEHYAIALAISLASFCLGLFCIVVTPVNFDTNLLSRAQLLIGIFLTLFGVIFALVFGNLLWDWKEHQKKIDWAYLAAFHLANDLPLPRHENKIVEATQVEPIEPNQPLNVIHETKDAQGRIASWKIENHPDRPSEDFVRHVFLSKTDGGLIPTERELQADGKKTGLWNTAQVKRWLEIFDQLEITKKVYESERGNSPRCLNRELTINQIREKFGYAEVKP